jgi:hypothetical protein
VRAAQQYTVLDRLLHRTAFLGPLQRVAADVEHAVYGRRVAHIPVERPIFITSLPRAGTTLVLERLVKFPRLATHCYRDMPFVLAPLLWARLSADFQRPQALTERAHGDGMQVGYDSPEAFEEILWRTFWQNKYAPDRIALWSADENADEFLAFFRSHVQGLIAARGSTDGQGWRYISKNNANIARLPLIRRLFPDASILVPFREPLAQAASLLAQHRRFSAIHRDDDFARRYMNDIGHLEFGDLHRPIAFEGMPPDASPDERESLDYWLRYWICAFRHILELKEYVTFVSYERLCRGGDPAVARLAAHLGLAEAPATPPDQPFWEPKVSAGPSTVHPDRLASAAAVHQELLSFTIL